MPEGSDRTDGNLESGQNVDRGINADHQLASGDTGNNASAGKLEMEVHHHPQLRHNPKPWKEYIYEGLMIFLAVMLGFFAENIRENISQGHRERNYINGLISNVQSDISALDGLIKRNESEIKGIDSLLRISKKNFLTTPVQDSIFFFATHYTTSLHIFEFNDLTLVQLRNAGGYSVIKTGKVADSIALYESKNNDIKLQETFVIHYYLEVWASLKQVFDITFFQQFYTVNKATRKIPATLFVLSSRDREKVNLVYNNYWTYNEALGSYNYKLRGHLEYLKKFTSFLKSSYGLH